MIGRPKREPVTHDYTDARRGLGHDRVFTPIDGGMRGRMMGWGPRAGPRIQAGDYILLSNGVRTTRYRFESVAYCDDPPDMWRADVAFAPRDQGGR